MSMDLDDGVENPAAPAAWLNDRPPAGPRPSSRSRTRRFVAPSLREAYALVRADLGADALIIDQRSAAGRVEVVAALEAAGGSSGASRERILARLRGHGYASAVLARLPAVVRGAADVERSLSRLTPAAPPPEPLCGRYRLLGPPGAGKTTALIKLMAARVLRYGRHGTLLIGTDRSRLAGCEQLAASAELLGVNYVECTEQALPATLEKWRHMQLVLVDAAGTRDAPPPAPLSGVQDLLAVPAVWQAGALRRLRGRFAGCPLDGVVLTHVDQAESMCECANVLAEWQLPVWWIGHGSDLAVELDRADEAVMGRTLFSEFDRSAVAAMFHG